LEATCSWKPKVGIQADARGEEAKARGEMKQKWELLRALVLRDVQSRYAQSVIGVLWAAIQPLALMFVFTLVFGRLLRTDTEGIPYPIFVYSCLVPWSFFTAALSRGTSSIEVEGGIIKKLAVSRILFPISAVLSCFVDFLAASFVFIIMCFWYHISWTPWMLMVFPLIALQTMLLIGLALFLGSLNAYFRDIKFGLPLLSNAWMYACPIVYSISVVPDRYRWFYDLNPMVGLMDAYRNVLVKGIGPDWQLLGVALLVTLVVGGVGYAVFSRLEGNFADIV
jgi:lipopolysaccharide transport system permease protein